MTTRELLAELEWCRKEYGEDFLDWNVFTEQLDEKDKEYKKTGGQKEWRKVIDGEGWEYFECHGFWTKMPKEKIFTINVNY